MATHLDSVTEIKLWPNEKGGKIAASGSIAIAETVYVRFRLMRKDAGGYFLALPSTKNANFDETKEVSDTNKKYYDEVICKSGNVYQALLGMVVEKYEEVTGKNKPAETKTTGKKKTGAITGDAAEPSPF